MDKSYFWAGLSMPLSFIFCQMAAERTVCDLHRNSLSWLVVGDLLQRRQRSANGSLCHFYYPLQGISDSSWAANIPHTDAVRQQTVEGSLVDSSTLSFSLLLQSTLRDCSCCSPSLLLQRFLLSSRGPLRFTPSGTWRWRLSPLSLHWCVGRWILLS